MNNLIADDIKVMRARYDEALELRGISATYQFPNLPTTNAQGETVVDSYSAEEPTYIFFDGTPKVKTYKRLGWAVENDSELPFLIHCSFNLPNLQRDCIFRISGQFTELPDRIFKVTELAYDIQAPDHIVCQVIPVYEKQVTGRTKEEVKRQYNSSHNFIKQQTDYRGQYYKTKENSKE